MRRIVAVSAVCTMILMGCGSTTGGTANGASGQPPANTDQSGNASQPAPQHSAPTSYFTAVNIHTKTMNVTYPQVKGMSDKTAENNLNSILKQAAVFHPSADVSASDLSSYSANYSVPFHQGDIADVVIQTYVMPNGAAHGMPVESSLWINLQTGREYTINDLFTDNQTGLTAVTGVVKAEDTNKQLDTFQPFTGVTAKDGFILQQGGLTVYFSPYEWSSYAAGFLAYPVPYTKIASSLNQSGELWKSMHSARAQIAAKMQGADLVKIKTLGYIPATANVAGHLNDASMAAEPDGHGGTLYAFNALRNNSKQPAEKVFFFDDSKYLGTDTLKAHGPVTALTPSGPADITATYVENAAPYQFSISYHWTGSKLVPSQSFPNGYNEWQNG